MRAICHSHLQWQHAEARATFLCEYARNAGLTPDDALQFERLKAGDNETWESVHAKLAWHYAEG